MTELKEVFEMTTKQMEPDQDSWNQQERRQRRTVRNRKVGALVVAAAIGLAAVVLIMELRPGGEAKTPANESAVINPGDEAVQVAEGSSTHSARSTSTGREPIWPRTPTSRG
jgi:hypothetical protein